MSPKKEQDADKKAEPKKQYAKKKNNKKGQEDEEELPTIFRHLDIPYVENMHLKFAGDEELFHQYRKALSRKVTPEMIRCYLNNSYQGEVASLQVVDEKPSGKKKGGPSSPKEEPNKKGAPTADESKKKGAPAASTDESKKKGAKPSSPSKGDSKKEGEFPESGMPEGQGTAKLADGHEYTGTFKNGLFHGNGTLKWSDGSSYTGEFRCNTITGKGRYEWPQHSAFCEGEVLFTHV